MKVLLFTIFIVGRSTGLFGFGTEISVQNSLITRNTEKKNHSHVKINIKKCVYIWLYKKGNIYLDLKQWFLLMYTTPNRTSFIHPMIHHDFY